MKRILLMVFKNILLVPVMWCKLCYYAGHVEKYTEQQIYKMLTFIVLRANKGGRVTIDVHGKENIPEKDGFMFFPNHQGMYDVLAIVEACSHPFSVVAKKEVENVQFLKQVFKCMKAYTMDRSDVRQAMKVITAVSKEVENGRNYLIFPEGTRSKNGNHVQSLKIQLPFRYPGRLESYLLLQSPDFPEAVLKSVCQVETLLFSLPSAMHSSYHLKDNN